jgi:predicted lipid carrier protein YhbT
MSDAPRHLAEGFARVVRGAPEERIEQFMHTPIRRVVLDGIFWQMPQHFDGKRAAGVSATIRWCITGRVDGGADVYDLRIADSRCSVKQRGSGDASVTITLDAIEFLKLATGNSDPMQAYFKRRITLAGDIMLAAKLLALFRIPARRTPGTL